MTTKRAYKLLHDGCIALSRVEAVGMRIDVERLERTTQKAGRLIKELEQLLYEDHVWEAWKGRFGRKSNLGSRAQLGVVLFDVLDLECKSRTQTGRAKVDESSLAEIDLPFVKTYIKFEKMKKLKGTYLKGVSRQLDSSGRIHPMFNLHLARTYRSSSDSPNFQNIPIRDPKMGKLIRSCFIPSDGHVLVEIDYGAIEVRVAACYHKDPTMLKYIEEGYDLHRDMAAQCYKLEQDQVTKAARYCGKNQFVFPEFYGDYYGRCAKSMWESVGRMHLETVSGIPLKEHLRAQGIRSYQAFEDHMKKVENHFWFKRFARYAQWKDQWYERYLDTGGFALKTGFYIQGAYSKNDVINYPVQGAAFHCLLWSLIKMVKWMNKVKMKSKIVGQIHDSLVADVHKEELGDYLAKAIQVMTQDIREEWSWIITPLEVEVEVFETNWFEKKEIKL